MMITDMGNNRVSIFKKYDKKKQFRFFRFLNDENNTNANLINPISITVSVTGKVFVLEGNFMVREGQKIKIFYPQKDTSLNNNSKILYKYDGEIKLNDLNNDQILYDKLYEEQTLVDRKIAAKSVRAVKIRIDDRGMLAISDVNNNSIHILGEHLSDDTRKNMIKFGDGKTTGTTYTIKPEIDLFEFKNKPTQIEHLENVPLFNRFRYYYLEYLNQYQNKGLIINGKHLFQENFIKT